MAEQRRDWGTGKSEIANPAVVEEFLHGVNYPCSKQDLISHARSMGAPDHVLQTIERIPTDKFYSPIDVSKGIGQLK